jgi:transcriptional regulator with XRE-family HTH domain
MAAFDAKEVGQRVKALRQAQELTQSALAEAAGVTDETISRLERGTYEPAVSTLVLVAEALGTTLDLLVHERMTDVMRNVGPATPKTLLIRRIDERLESLDVPTLRALAKVVDRIS